jgi:hypothetical protein
VYVLVKNQASEPLEAPVRTVAKRTQVNTATQRMQVENVALEYYIVVQDKLQSSCVQNHAVQTRKKIQAPK